MESTQTRCTKKEFECNRLTHFQHETTTKSSNHISIYDDCTRLWRYLYLLPEERTKLHTI